MFLRRAGSGGRDRLLLQLVSAQPADRSRARLPISLDIVHGHLKGMCCSQCITRPLQPVLHERKARTRCNIGPRHIGHVETLSGGVQGVIAEWQGCHAVVNR